MKTLKLIWETYTVRQEVSKLGFIYSYEENGYIWNCNEITEKLENQIKDLWLRYEEIEFIEINEEYIVKQKNIRAQNKYNKYIDRACSTSKKANNTKLSQQESNFLSLAEPVKIWHHSEGRHRKLIEKSRRIMDKRVELWNKAEEYDDKADYWKNKKFLTTSEKEEKKQLAESLENKALELWRNDYKVWDEYTCWHAYKPMIIAKINKNTVRVESGSKWDIKYSKDFNEYLLKAKELWTIQKTI